MFPFPSDDAIPGFPRANPGDAPSDRLCRLIQVSLAVYLSPVIVLVGAIGVASIATHKLAGAFGRVAGAAHAGRQRLPALRDERIAGLGPTFPHRRHQERVGR